MAHFIVSLFTHSWRHVWLRILVFWNLWLSAYMWSLLLFCNVHVWNNGQEFLILTTCQSSPLTLTENKQAALCEMQKNCWILRLFSLLQGWYAVNLTNCSLLYFTFQELCSNFGGCRQDLVVPCWQQNKWTVCQDIWYWWQLRRQQVIQSSKRDQVICWSV